MLVRRSSCSCTSASSALALLGLLLGFVVLAAPSFDATYSSGGHSCDIEANVYSLKSCDKDATSIFDFCHSDASTCHGDSCQHLHHEFCRLHMATFVINHLALFLLLLAVCASCSFACALAPEKSRLVARVNAWILVASTVLFVVAIVLWSAAKTELPDLTADSRWVYLPQSTPREHEWGYSWGYGLSVVVAVMVGAAAGCAHLGYCRQLQHDSPEELVELPGAMQGGAVQGEVRLHVDALDDLEQPSPVVSGTDTVAVYPPPGAAPAAVVPSLKVAIKTVE